MKKKPSQEIVFNLTEEEQAIEDALERGEYETVENLPEAIKEAQQIARNTVAKTKAINIRLSEKDLIKLRAAAMRKGLPYQTYVASLIHQAVETD